LKYLTKNLYIAIILVLSAATTAFSQNVTFSGRVTDQATSQGIANVAVVALGNQTGTRVSVTDSQGVYSITMGPNTHVRLRAYRQTYVFNPAQIGFVSLGPPMTGTVPLDFTGTAIPFPILIFGQAPVALTEDNSFNALALDSVFLTRDPLKLTNDNYFGNDKRTRITLLLVDLDLFSGENLSIVTAQGIDSSLVAHSLVVEDLRKVPGVPWMTQLTLRLPGGITAPNELTITVSARSQTSNATKLKIQ
jgi:hypothetical protein